MCIFDRKGFNSKLSNPMTILTMILRAQQWRDGWRLKTHLVSPNQGAAAAQPGSGAKWRRVETNRRPILTESSSFKETNPEKALSRKTPFASSSSVAPTWWHHSFSFLAPGREKKIHFFFKLLLLLSEVSSTSSALLQREPIPGFNNLRPGGYSILCRICKNHPTSNALWPIEISNQQIQLD